MQSMLPTNDLQQQIFISTDISIQDCQYDEKSQQEEELCIAEFSSVKYFCIRTFALIIVQMMIAFILCLLCINRSQFSQILWDGKTLRCLFYISISICLGMLYVVYQCRGAATRAPFAQLIYCIITLCLSIIIAAIYSSSYEQQFQTSLGWTVIASLNVYIGAVGGAIFYLLMQSEQRPLKYSIPYLIAFPILVSIRYMKVLENYNNWTIFFTSFSVALVYYQLWALFQIVNVSKLSKYDYFVGPMLIQIKTLIPCIKII